MNDRNTPLSPSFLRGESLSVLLAHPDKKMLEMWERSLPPNLKPITSTDIFELFGKIGSRQFDIIVLSLDLASAQSRPYIVAQMIKYHAENSLLVGVSNYSPNENTDPINEIFNEVIVGEQELPNKLEGVVGKYQIIQ